MSRAICMRRLTHRHGARTTAVTELVMTRYRFWLVVSYRLVLITGALLGSLSSAAAQQMEMMPPNQAALIRNLLPAVVNITAYVGNAPATAGMNVASPSSQAPDHPRWLLGSGFVIDPSGVILTNDHVIDGAYDIHVTFSDGTRVSGRVIAATPVIDLALIKVETQHPLTVVHWADSDKVRIGDPVFAIGNPLGIGLSVTSGIVSGLNRNLGDSPYDEYIQTDAAINHGNSGGPLFDRSGGVIGIDTAIISPTTGSVGLGFAIPSNDVHFVAERLLRNGKIRPAFIGIKIEQVTQDMAVALGLPKPMGSIVALVREGGPAARAGLQVGDVILGYDNQTPSDERALLRDIAKSGVGHTVPVMVLRDGRELTMSVTPGDWPKSLELYGAWSGQAPRPVMLVPADLGLSLRALTADQRTQHGLSAQQAGVLIGSVAADTDAFERGLVSGDVILRAQNTDVHTPEEFQAAVDAARAAHKAFILALVLPKVQQTAPGPQWMALRVQEGADQESQSAHR
jgi:serine protease Do